MAKDKNKMLCVNPNCGRNNVGKGKHTCDKCAIFKWVEFVSSTKNCRYVRCRACKMMNSVKVDDDLKDEEDYLADGRSFWKYHKSRCPNKAKFKLQLAVERQAGAGLPESFFKEFSHNPSYFEKFRKIGDTGSEYLDAKEVKNG
ncbi:hypothetical protein GOV11_00830 [Candidatus Woesearchaeota archaeon]|nr:hypothetical protein [Candidatus Woesearchaeota archaeon]